VRIDLDSAMVPNAKMPATFIARSPRSKVRVLKARCESSSSAAATRSEPTTRHRRARPKKATPKKASPPYANRCPILSNGERWNKATGKCPAAASAEAQITRESCAKKSQAHGGR
jgi:hypothetical protein